MKLKPTDTVIYKTVKVINGEPLDAYDTNEGEVLKVVGKEALVLTGRHTRWMELEELKIKK